MMTTLVREGIENRLIMLNANRKRHELVSLDSSTPDVSRHRAQLSLLSTGAAILELEWVLQVMLAFAMDRALEDGSMLKQFAAEAGVRVGEIA